jgi:hypothetical protein
MTPSDIPDRVSEVRRWFPSARWALLPHLGASSPTLVISLELAPFAVTEASRIAFALHHQRPMTVSEDGSLVMVGNDQPRLFSVPLRALQPVTWTIEFHFPADQTHPSIFAVGPLIVADERHVHPHLYTNQHPTLATNGLCVYGAHLKEWDPDTGDMYTLVHWTSAWLASHQIWLLTNRWLGRQASHDLREIVQQHGGSECFCGSRRPMAACCGRLLYPARVRVLPQGTR